jgi:hypothetical protein
MLNLKILIIRQTSLIKFLSHLQITILLKFKKEKIKKKLSIRKKRKAMQKTPIIRLLKAIRDQFLVICQKITNLLN